MGDLEAIANLRVDLELEVPGDASAEVPTADLVQRYQRRRTRLGALAVRVDQRALDAHVVSRAAAGSVARGRRWAPRRSRRRAPRAR
ncbi:MAG: hypothetical protein K8M05_02190, partial [Deltaproteobacteria bacterium]|nr:hypothetical protein [Kofleriaceae bacterium]